ncbi:MAG TPA: PD-(D/E)XK nuclease family protein [Ohtaekwangia sp.]|nr:PD-(D/E)XK nuclease family protein [Ohtaekwangia sp.]
MKSNWGWDYSMEPMKTFLQDFARAIAAQYGNRLNTVTVVFPNRRATLYFRRHLSLLLDKPVFSPTLVTIEDFIAGFASFTIPDKLQLIHRLHKVYAAIAGSGDHEAETFDQFFFWGDMLLRDFDEVDKYMVNAPYLFKDLSHQKELDASFDFLTAEQREFLKTFWLNFDEHDSVNKRKFLRLWKQLPEVYRAFRASLLENNEAYEGMAQRLAAERIGAGEITIPSADSKQVIFAGFNALTRAEEMIISAWVENGDAKVYWDLDAYYTNNNTQEAGRFFREYQQHPVLGKTFPHDVPSNFLEGTRVTPDQPGVINLYGASQSVGQVKMAAQVLHEQLQKGAHPEDTVIILPDEKLLMPVLHSISGAVEKLNVTMGFPLSATPLFNMVEVLIDLQITKKDDEFNHRAVLALLGHPYVVAADAASAKSKSKQILTQSWISIPGDFLASAVPLHRVIFQDVQPGRMNMMLPLLHYLRAVIQELGTLTNLNEFDKEYCFHFLKLLNRMEEVLGKDGVSPPGERNSKSEKESLRAFLRLFRQLIRSEKIPFRGEPLTGLQVMGVLETRNLDFKNVFILSLNEGAFPSFGSKGSYIPHNIRRAYGLPTTEHQDAIYAYLFYRVLQRAENLFLFYNTETDILGQGEMSRYLQQLLYESGAGKRKFILHNPMQPTLAAPISIAKDQRVFTALAKFLANSSDLKYLSPTALNDYIECRLKFYFRYVAGIKEARAVEDDLDARILGNFLHKVMERFYLSLQQRKGNRTVVPEDFKDYSKSVSLLIDEVIRDTYHLDPSKPVVYEGQRLVVREVVMRFIDEIIKKDKAYAPFEMVGLETNYLRFSIRLQVEGNPEVLMGGSVDRADRKGDVIRVIDYKTGKDSTSVKGPLSDLFSREGDRNKAAFQTLMYALLFHKNFDPGQKEKLKLVPGLMNRVNLFDENFTFGLKVGNQYVQDAVPLLPEFEANLTALLEDLYNPARPFDQTEDERICKWCPYREICCR